jgi:uncharacterized Fe-S cluster protein YjdI
MSSEHPSDGPVHRQYVGDGIVVHWEPAYCIHSGNCTRNLAAVFDPRRRPWVDASLATADQIAAAIQRCPSGALRYERTDGAAQEPASDGVEVDPQPNGPLYVRGNVEIKGANGNVIRRATRVALCRCGCSSNKPFCDRSHRKIGFVA